MIAEVHQRPAPASRPGAAGTIRYLLFLVVFVTVVFGSLELCLHAVLRHPQTIPAGLLDRVRDYYSWNLREIVQFKPECARYDDKLFYTLRPGSCSFSSLEFDTTISVNSRGLRDDEDALHAPEIVVAGDSFAMGWGVEQRQTFAARIEALTGRKTLNAGIPSYGTAREMMLFASLDRSAIEYLVIQYSETDLGENVKFQQFQNQLPISSRALYDEMTKLAAQSSRYFPGKYATGLLPLLLGRRQQQSKLLSLLFRDEGAPSEDPFQPAETFLNVLFSFSRELAGITIIVIHVPPRGQADYSLIGALQHLRTAYPDNALLNQMVIVDLAGVMKPEHYFTLDDHLRESGHEAIARALAPHLQPRSAAPATDRR